MRFNVPALLLLAATSLTDAKRLSKHHGKKPVHNSPANPVTTAPKAPPIVAPPIVAPPVVAPPAGGSPGKGSTRPIISYHPKSPTAAPPSPLARTKVCNVESHNDGITDDGQYVLDAVKACNNGGHVIFQKDLKYTIGTALDLSNLNSIDIDIQGTIQFTKDTKYWEAHSFRFVFQNVTSFFKLGGNDVFVYGGGTIHGNGQVWYDAYAANIYTLRPVLFGIAGLHNSIISDVVLRYSPQYYFFVMDSSNVVFDNVDIAGGSLSVNPAKNTDGWDTYRSKDIVIQNCHVVNGDDCIAFKPNSTNILVQNIFCDGSHGISVGSLGQYPGQFDIVENVYVVNTTLAHATDGARIKVWPNHPSALSGDLQGGGGDGRVNNITYDQMTIDQVDFAFEINQCYGNKNLTQCLEHPSPLTISNVLFKNFKGKTTAKYSPQVGVLACSSTTACKNIVASAIDLLSPVGTEDVFCLNVDPKLIDAKCVDTFKAFN